MASEDYYRTMNQFRTAKINNKDGIEDDEADKENIIELPREILEVLSQKLQSESNKTDLPMSPQTDKNSTQKKKRRPKSSNHDQNVIDRLYMSPSPFQLPEDQEK